MSYILDALRKSEEQRRLASTPDLGTEHRPAGSSGRGNARLAALLGAGLLLNALVIGTWLFWPRGGDSERDPGSAGPTAAAPAGAAQPSPPRRIGADPEIREAAESRTPTAMRPATPARPSRVSPSAPAQAAEADSTDIRGVDPAIDRETPTAPDAAERSGEVASGTGTGTAIGPDTGSSTGVETQTGTDPAPGQRPPAPGTEPVPIRALPEDFRQRIGPLSFSTHIYADEPRFREVAINGRVHREGARIGALRLLEITEDGVIMELEGRSFSVSVLQDWDY